MSFSVDIISLLLYCAQQLGVMLGVGSASILLIAYLVSMRDGAVDSKEEQFGRAVTTIQSVGLWIIIASGLAITAMHIANGTLDIVLSPAFLFKWALIGFIFSASLFRQNKPYPHFIWEGVVGANWYALFIVHIVAPVTTWPDLIVLYVLWSAGFVLSYTALVYAMRAPSPVHEERSPRPAPVQKKVEQPVAVSKPIPKIIPEPVKKPTLQPALRPMESNFAPQLKTIFSKIMPIPASKPTPPPVVVPKLAPVQSLPEHIPAPMPMIEVDEPSSLSVIAKAPQKPAMQVPHKPPMPVPHKPALAVPKKPEQKATDPDENPGLPAIRVMPRTQQDVDKQNRATTVQFS